MKNNGGDDVWWSEIKMNCAVPVILYIWIAVPFVSSADSRPQEAVRPVRPWPYHYFSNKKKLT